MAADFDVIDQLIRSGETRRARAALTALKWRQLPRSQMSKFANLCRRAQAPTLAARALFPVVRRETPGGTPANADELAEYAVALQRLGANREALEILHGLTDRTDNPRESAQRGLYISFCLVSQWKYQEAFDVLRRALDQAVGDAYLQRIITINLLAAQIAVGETDGLSARLQDLEEELRHEGAHRLRANALELRAQVHLLRGELDDGENALQAAASLHQDQQAWDQLYIRKWRGILRALKTGDPDDLLQLRAEVEGTGHYESLREIDFHLLRARFEQSRFDYLYFGTPHRSYRRRLLDIGAPLNVDESTEVHLPGAPAPTDVIDPMMGLPDLGGVPHRVTQLLLRDFYHPYRVAEIFGHLHPDEYFDPETSPNRVHQSLHAARVWYEKLGLDLRIVSRGTRFRLSWSEHYRLRVREAILPVTTEQIFQYRLELAASQPETYWSRQEVQTELGCSRASATRFLDPRLNPLILEKRGAGPHVRYRVRPYSKWNESE